MTDKAFANICLAILVICAIGMLRLLLKPDRVKEVDVPEALPGIGDYQDGDAVLKFENIGDTTFAAETEPYDLAFYYDHSEMLRLEFHRGKIKAIYKPEDLDEAAQLFIKYLTKLEVCPQ